MNMWGFTGGFMKELVKRFPVFLEKSIPENPLYRSLRTIYPVW